MIVLDWKNATALQCPDPGEASFRTFKIKKATRNGGILRAVLLSKQTRYIQVSHESRFSTLQISRHASR